MRRLNLCVMADAQEIIVLSEPMVQRVLDHVPFVESVIVIPGWVNLS